MLNDPIVDEVRQARKDILDSHNGDYKAMLQSMMKNQWDHGNKVVNPKKKETQLK